MSRKHRKNIEEEKPSEEQPEEETTEVAEEEPAEETTETPVEELPSDIADAFEIDTGKAGRGKGAIDPVKFRQLVEAAIVKMEELKSPGVSLPITDINRALGTNSHNNNSLAYRLKTGKVTKPILEALNIYVGGRGSWNGEVKDQKIAFVKIASKE